MGADGQFPRNDIVHESENSLFDVGTVGGLLNVGAQLFSECVECLGGIGEEEQTSAVIVANDLVDVDADEKANMRDVLKVGA